MAILILDDKLGCFDLLGKYFLGQNDQAFNLGLVLPPSADGFPTKRFFLRRLSKKAGLLFSLSERKIAGSNPDPAEIARLKKANSFLLHISLVWPSPALVLVFISITIHIFAQETLT